VCGVAYVLPVCIGLYTFIRVHLAHFCDRCPRVLFFDTLDNATVASGVPVRLAGEEKFPYEEADRGLISFEKFFSKNIPGFVVHSIDGSSRTSRSPSPAASKQDDDVPTPKVAKKAKGTLSKPKVDTPEAPKAAAPAPAASAPSSAPSEKVDKLDERVGGLEKKLDRMEDLLLQLLQQNKKSAKDEL
jgi:hypothetical protein